jgi:hypothetical protein
MTTLLALLIAAVGHEVGRQRTLDCTGHCEGGCGRLIRMNKGVTRRKQECLFFGGEEEGDKGKEVMESWREE